MKTWWCQPEELQQLHSGELEMVYVNAYEITRHYGGPEEGGWWYNIGEPLAAVPVTTVKQAVMQRRELRKLFAHINHGDIYSVLGGAKLGVCIEEVPAQYWPSERPRYC